MRPETQKRLIALLQADISKLQAKCDAKPLEAYMKACRELDELVTLMLKPKTQRHLEQLLIKGKKTQSDRDKAWKESGLQVKNWAKWYEEISNLERDLHSLKYSFAYKIH